MYNIDSMWSQMYTIQRMKINIYIYRTCVALHMRLSGSYVPKPHPRPDRAPSRPPARGSG